MKHYYALKWWSWSISGNVGNVHELMINEKSKIETWIYNVFPNSFMLFLLSSSYLQGTLLGAGGRAFKA